MTPLRAALAAFVLLVSIAPGSRAGVREFAAHAGVTIPGGEFLVYGDTGPVIAFRLSSEDWGGQAWFPVIDLAWSWYSETESRFDYLTELGTVPTFVDDIETAGSAHVGLQIAPPVERGPRPRLQGSIGFHFFRWSTTVTRVGSGVPFGYATNDSRAEFGWRGVAGLDWFVNPRWGVSVEALYDAMFGRDEDVLTRERDRRRFLGFRAGVVFRPGRPSGS